MNERLTKMLLGGGGITSVEMLSSVDWSELIKALTQVAVGLVTIYTMLVAGKKKNTPDGPKQQ